MKHESKQRAQEQEQVVAASAQETKTREFASTEELLRHDAAQTEVPPVVAERLTKSIANLPRPAKTWWQRLLKR